MQLSHRMQSVADLVTPGECLADIGTDHGYIPIEMVRTGRTKRAIAMDVKEGPLKRAMENIHRADLEEKIEIRLSDGAKGLKPYEADRAVIAGMGGALMIRILEEGDTVFQAMEELILQPQSELGKVREYLQKHGWQIEKEDMVEEDGKYYPMMRAVRGTMPVLSSEEALYGPLLLKEKNKVLKEFLEKEWNTYEKIKKSLKQENSDSARWRLEEIEEKMNCILGARKQAE